MRLPLVETFLSLQGEGPTAGRPAVFVRSAHCTLDCVWCDTAAVWKSKGEYVEGYTLAERLYAKHQEAFERGALLVITGGSPLMFGNAYCEMVHHLRSLLGHRRLTVEVETEGVLLPTESGIDLAADRYNVSPKLENSGMSLERRRIIKTLEWHAHDPRSIFKFVVAKQTDLYEVIELTTVVMRVEPKRVWLMPCASNRTDLIEAAPVVAALALELGFNLSSRLQVLLWDKTTGV